MKELAHVTAVETRAERTGGTAEAGALANLVPAAATALRLLADAVRRGSEDADAVVQALQDAGVHEAFADNLSCAASGIRDAFHWL